MLSQVVKISILFLLGFCTLIEPVFSQDQFEFSGKRKRQQINFKAARGLVVVPMYINHKGPFNFILDTGVGITIITDPKLKDSLDLKYLRKMQLYGLGEDTSLSAYTTPFLDFKVGAAQAKSCAAAILDQDVLNLSGYAGMPIHGLLGYDFFKSFKVRINYQSRFLKIYKNNLSIFLRKGNRINLDIEENKPYVNVIADATEHKKIPLKMLIDTGSGNTLSLESYQKSPFPLPNKFVIANLGVGLGGNIRGFKGRLEKLKIGKFGLDSIIAAFPYYEDVAAKITSVERNGSIGNPFFKKFDVLFDYQNSCIYLKGNTTLKEPFEYDMSGLELVASGNKFDEFFVTRVEIGSPADEFGVKVGDQLLSINFNPAEKLSLDEICQIFSSKNDRSLYLEMARGQDIYRGILTLKRRI
ncbi:aspartyl protease family protein [Pedobacter sp. SD-b]|uniref:Aspartyl protease family protein n=1 Tax=Pedobacter segetis TaxID=2793069 RepID=A0ABS1BLE4_9SPHI|nr:aspartyl protease family protein [Pedobacter segetis]MBK0383719.1 aspartyl protease family protein [Pedobacter segetis]